MCLDNTRDGNVVDDESPEVMLRIEKEMQRLKVMGSDDRRTLWLEIHIPDKEGYCIEDRCDKNGNIWYWVTTANYNGICPEFRKVENPESEIELLENVRNSPLTVFEEMTLNVYMHCWRLAYVAYSTHDSHRPESPDRYDVFDDCVLFSRYNNVTSEPDDYSLDSQEGYIKWEEENSSCHSLDVVYARIHLWPQKDGSGK